MKEDYHKWYSNRLGRDFEMLVFGHTGLPVVLYPTSYGRYYENKERGLIGAIAPLIEGGHIKVYCPDGIDKDTWYNKHIHPADRVRGHQRYEEVIAYEVVPRGMYETNHDKIIMSGCSFGGLHALNFSCHYPHLVSYLISMSGGFEIRSFLDGYYDDFCYQFNPAEYVPNLEGETLEKIQKIGVILGAGERDICKDSNYDMSHKLNEKGVTHWFDIKPRAVHDWDTWHAVFPEYLKAVINHYHKK